MTTRAPSDAGPPQPLKNRFSAAREIGGGGMAVVYEVFDESRGRKVALKRPRPQVEPEHARRLHELFAREFMTLSQLAHPRIVEVYDYGVDELGPYYTMELLDGGDLQESVPLEVARVCSIARDVCSALSILHSRRAVHRDVSPRNVRCTIEGTAKLIDFGAMTSMGPAKELVGTPAYCAPEMLNHQPLDARTDLYAFGATLYYVLTGRHAYPARDFSSLSAAWSFGFARPSELVPGIPAALDALVLDLLQLEPAARPSSAAEVMERLAAIEGRAVDEQLLVAQAYLSAPELVGRELERERLFERSTRERGSVMLIEGPDGVGRSRLLDDGLLRSKLAGKLVLRTTADDSFDGDYGAVRALVRQLGQLVPEIVREVAGEELPVELGLEWARWVEHGTSVSALPAAELQAALRRLFSGVARRTPLVVGVDDLHRIDELSITVLALVAQDVARAPLVLVATWIPSAAAAAGSALRLFVDASTRLLLSDLMLHDTRALLCSVFGESPQLDALAHRDHAITGGNPLGVMRLAQHLVDAGVARYRSGSWTLPSRLDVVDLPSSVNQLLGLRVQNLSASQRELAAMFALSADQSYSFEECAWLAEQPEPSRAQLDLERLVQADIVRQFGERYRLADRVWVEPLLAGRAVAERRVLHARLAGVFERRSGEDFRVAQHLLRAGEHDRALDRFVAHASASQVETDRDPVAFDRLIRALPPDWQETYDEVLQACRERGRPKREAHVIRSRLAGLLAVAGLHGTNHLADSIVQLRRESGLDDWEALDPALAPQARLGQAMQRAKTRYDETPENERVLDPVSAMRALVRAVSDSVGLAAPRLDLDALRALPSLAPFATLSPALAVIEQLREGAIARVSGRFDRAREIYAKLLVQTSGADRAGLLETQHRAVRSLVGNALAMIEASMGLASSLDFASVLEIEPAYRVHAVSIRMMYELWQGKALEADHYRRKIDLSRIESGTRQPLEHSHLVWQITAYAAMEDLTRLKRCADEIAAVASDSRGWQLVDVYARAVYQRARGDLASARELLAGALGSIDAGEHILWAHLAGAQLWVLQELGAVDEAIELGMGYLQRSERAAIGFNSNHLLQPLAVAQAIAGRPEARATAERALERLRELGATGLNLGIACEACARVALEEGDQERYDAYSASCSDEFLRSGNPALSARYQRLRRAAQQKRLVTVPPIAQGSSELAAAKNTAIRAELTSGKSLAERASLALGLLAAESGAREGYLYHVSASGPALVASIGVESPPPATLHAMVCEYVAGETMADEATTGEETTMARTDWTVLGEAVYRPVLLSHYVDDGFAITGIAVFRVGANESFNYPRDAALQLSQLSVELGDVTSVVVSE